MAREFRHIDEIELALENLSPFQRAQQETADAKSEADEAQAFYNFFRRHPELDATDANQHVMKLFIGDGVHITLGLLEDALRILKDEEHFRLSLRTTGMDEREREEIVQKIIDLKNVSGNGDAAWEANERARLNLRNPTTQQYVRTLGDLRQLLEETELRAKFQKMSVQELREIVKPKQQPQFPPLPQKWTGPIIRASSAQTIRNLLQNFGEQQVNERINERS